MKEVTLQSIVNRKRDIVTADMFGEVVMLNVEKGQYYNISVTGSAVWGIIDDPIPVDSVIEKVLEKYDVTKKQCEEEVLAFLNVMYEEGLVDVK
jgi:hypothetical protein